MKKEGLNITMGLRLWGILLLYGIGWGNKRGRYSIIGIAVVCKIICIGSIPVNAYM